MALLFDLFFLIGCAILVNGFGLAILRVLGLQTNSLWEDCLYGQCLGWVIVSYASLAIGFWQFSWASLGGILALASLFGIRETRKLLQKLWTQKKQIMGIFPVAVWVVLIFIVLLHVIRSHAPATVEDELTYHLYPLKYYLANQIIELPQPYSPMHYYPQTVEMIYGLVMSLRSDMAARMLHCLWGLEIALCIALWSYRETLRLGSSRASARLAAGLSVLAFYSMPITAALSGVAYIDFAIAALQIASLAVLLRFKETGNMRWIFLAGFFIASATACKYPSVVFFFVIAILLMAILWRDRQIRSFPWLKIGLVFFGVTLLFWMPWLLRNWFWTGNPAYPFPFAKFPSDPMAREYLSAKTQSFYLFKNAFHVIRSFISGLYAGEGGIFWGAGPAVSLLILGISARKTTAMKFWIAAALINLLVLLVLFKNFLGNWKYAITSHALFAALLSVSIVHWQMRGKPLVYRLGVLGIILPLIFPTSAYAIYGAYKRFKLQIGGETREEFLRQHYNYEGYAVIEYCNRELPESARILSIWDFWGPFAYYYKRTIQEASKDLVTEESQERVLESLRAQGITHVLLPKFLYKAQEDGSYQFGKVKLLWINPLLRQKKLQKLYEDDRAILFAVNL